MKNKTLLCILLISVCCFGVLYVNAYASDGGNENMIVNAAWLDGEMLRIDVTDEQTGKNSSLAIRLSDYIKETDNSEYISIQAVDLDGKKSVIVQLKNPYYKPEAETEAKEQEQSGTQDGETAADGSRPFTPNGSGTVVDNATDGDGKEFFTIQTEDESVFYLIVDRQRSSDNVYLLNSVTESDLMALAEKNGKDIGGVNNSGTSAIPTPEPVVPEQNEQPQAAPEPEPVAPPKNGIDVGTIVFIAFAAIIAGGAGYYFKIYKPKNEAHVADDEDM